VSAALLKLRPSVSANACSVWGMSEPAREPRRLFAGRALRERVAGAILDAAARTFAARGEVANLGEVAVAAGVARATVYRYFPNRRRLLEELVRRAAEDAHARLEAARVSEVAVEEGITRAVRAFVDMGDAFVVLVGERDRARAGEFDRLVAGPLRGLLEEGRSAGRVREDVPAAWLAEALVGVVAAALRRGALGRDDTVAATTRVFFEGVLLAGERE
jgi:TetR/AcrR family transcriptional regulator, mexCD-oprJ operon repressor